MAARLAEIAAPFGRFEILFIDDCSTDGTLAEVKTLAEHDPRIRFVAFTRNFGHQAALRAGLRYARGDARSGLLQVVYSAEYTMALRLWEHINSGLCVESRL